MLQRVTRGFTGRSTVNAICGEGLERFMGQGKFSNRQFQVDGVQLVYFSAA